MTTVNQSDREVCTPCMNRGLDPSVRCSRCFCHLRLLVSFLCQPPEISPAHGTIMSKQEARPVHSKSSPPASRHPPPRHISQP
eukprot:Skav219936  [mRNA]  locus=scaffold1807:61140:61405:+ [translate_table: standard]